MAVLLLTGLLLSSIVLMFATQFDRVVTSSAGKIVPKGQVNVFQALDASIIKSIDVREGDQVQKGQLLATLDQTFTSADVNQLRMQIESLDAQVARDEAELAGTPLNLPQGRGPDFEKYAALQKSLYYQRSAQYASQINSFDAKIQQTRATIDKLKGDSYRYRQRDEVALKIETMRSTLAEHGTGSQLNLYISQDARLELLRTVENTRNSLVEAQNTLTSFEADREAFKQQWSAALSQDLVTTRNKLDDARQLYEKASKHQDLVRLSATEPSVVLTLAKLSIGSVLKQGDPLLTLMPVDTGIEAEIKIASRDIGFIQAKDRCTLKVDAFNSAEHGSAFGSVQWISEGAFTTGDDGQPVEAYYKARCSVDEVNFKHVPNNFRLIPGMTLTGDVNVGTRSVAMYLLGGMVRGLKESMREP